MAGLNCTGLRMKHLPHALFGHRWERSDLICHFVNTLNANSSHRCFCVGAKMWAIHIHMICNCLNNKNTWTGTINNNESNHLIAESEFLPTSNNSHLMSDYYTILLVFWSYDKMCDKIHVYGIFEVIKGYSTFVRCF